MQSPTSKICCCCCGCACIEGPSSSAVSDVSSDTCSIGCCRRRCWEGAVTLCRFSI